MAQDWEVPPPEAAPAAAPTAWPAPPTAWAATPTAWPAAPALTPEMTAAQAMRPLTTGEVLDRTFSVYRSHFWLFAGLASFSGACSLVLNLLQLLVHHVLLVREGFRIATLEAQFSGIILLLLLLPVGAVVYAASVFAVCEVYLGREISIKSAIQATIGRWLRYVGIALWQGWSALWVILLLGVPAAVLIGIGSSGGNQTFTAIGGVLVILAILPIGGTYGVIAYIRNSLAIPAALMEDTGVRASMRRSKTLAKGTKGRIFVVFLIAFVLYMVAGAVEAPMLFIIGRAPLQEHVLAQSAVLLIGFLAHTLVSPVALVGLTLVYFDQRVRNEAFDLLMLLGPEIPPSPVAYAPAEPVVYAAAPAEPAPEPLPSIEEPPAARTDDETLP